MMSAARPGTGSSGRARGWVGWLAVAALLLHGWLPIVLQVQLTAPEAAGHAHHGSAAGHAHNGSAASAKPPRVPSGEGPECPLFHGAICLCAAFVKLLQTPALAAPLVAAPVRRARGRFAAGRPPRQRRAELFDPRAPPSSD
jgi:hypothetical protein